MAYGVTHTETIPTVSTTAGPDYAEQVNACLEEIRDTLDAKVTPTGFDMDSDLSFESSGTSYAAVDLERTNYENKLVAISAGTYPMSVYVVDGELYYNDNDGNQVQITSGGSLNIAVSGGITGSGYGSSGVEVNWAVGDSAYKLKSGASSYAHVWLNDVYLNDGDTNFIRLAAPAITADYTVTFPTAVPASELPVTMNGSGTLATNGTLANLVSFTTSGNGTVGGNLQVTGTTTSTGLITATAGVTAASGQHVTVSGTGRFKHGSYIRHVSAFAGHYAGSEWEIQGNGYLNVNAGGAGGSLFIPLPLKVGERLTAAIAQVHGDGTNTLTADVYYVDDTGTRSSSLATYTSATTATDQTLPLVTGNQDVANNQYYYIEIAPNTPDSTLKVYGIAYTFTHP